MRRIDDRAIKAHADLRFRSEYDYALFEFGVDSCVLGLRGADEWPPRYTTWRATPA